MRRWTGIVLVTVATHALAGQATRPLFPHQRMRVWVTDSAGTFSVTGSLVGYTPLWLSVVPAGHVWPQVFGLDEVDAIETSAGQSPLLRYGAMLAGLGAGVWLGATGRLESQHCQAAGAADPRCEWITSPSVVGGGFGVIITAIAGRFLLPERWRTVIEHPGPAERPMPQFPRLGLQAPQPNP